MTHTSSGQKSCSEYHKFLSLVLCYLFNIFICYLFLFASDSNIANYTDDNTPYSAKQELMIVLNDLVKDSNVQLK